MMATQDSADGVAGEGAAFVAEQRLAARMMMGRIGELEDVANAIVFLASPESGWINAQTPTMDGCTTLGHC
jgi:NAD(P)-dependent dehydrogenase (short-subunit alcohol dehydrogenase family)